MTEQELYWLAGYLEGEGCFTFQHGTPRIAVGATDKDVVDKVAQLMGAQKVYTRKYIDPKHKTAYEFQVWGAQAIEIMELILPLMGERRAKKIHEVLALAKARPGSQKGTYNGYSRLTEHGVHAIRFLLSRGYTQAEIGRRFGVSYSCVAAIKHKTNWKHLEQL